MAHKSRAIKQQRHLASKARHQSKRRDLHKQHQHKRLTQPAEKRQSRRLSAPSPFGFLNVNEWLQRRFGRGGLAQRISAQPTAEGVPS